MLIFTMNETEACYDAMSWMMYIRVIHDLCNKKTPNIEYFEVNYNPRKSFHFEIENEIVT